MACKFVWVWFFGGRGRARKGRQSGGPEKPEMAIGVVSLALWNFSGECLSSTGLNKLQGDKGHKGKGSGRKGV